MRTRLRGKFPLLFIALAVLLAIPAIALADNVVNNVSVTPSTGGQKQLTVEAGKTSTAVAYRINATGGDTTDTTGPTGQNCNPVVTPAKLTISGLPAGVSVKDSTGNTTLTAPHLTFTTCGVDQSVKFAVANNTTPGNYAITVADITNNGYTSGDFAELNGTFNLVVTADVTSPDTVIDTGPSGTVTSDSATFTFHSTEANSTFETRLDNGTWLANGTATSKTYNSLSNAPHTFDVRAKDPSGNVDASPATQTWTVNTVPPNSAPQVSVTGVTNNGSYEIGSEPTPDCSVVDAEDTGESADPVVDRSALNSFGLGTVTVTCSYEDTGGLDDSDTVSYTVVDTNGPSSFHQLSAEANGNGWHNANVTVTLTGTDSTPGSGLKEIRYSTDGGASYSVYNSASKPVISTEGTTTFSYHAVDNANNSETDNSFTIKLDKTDPTITASRTAGPNANGWNNSDVTVEFSCDDNLSGVDASDCSDDAVLGEGANQSATGTATDRAGNTASVTENDINVDKTDPTITATRTPGPNANGWNKTDVTVEFSCDDNLSGVDGSCGPDQTLENEGANQSATGNVTDRAGNTASLTENVNIDKTAPVVTPGTVSGTKGLGSWYTTAVTQAFNANDVLSGIDGANSDSQTSTTEGAGVQLTSRTFSDKAGNTATGSATFDIDLSNPLLRITGAASGTTYTACGAAPTRPTYDPFDAISGLDGSQGDSWTPPTNGVGTYTYTAHAKDNAGRTTSETRTYTRTYGSAYTGLLQPINAGSTPRSVFKLGSTVPLKFLLACGSTPITNANATFSLTKVDSTVDGAVNETVVELAASTGNQFRLSDATTGQYIYNLSTKSLAQGTYNLNVDLHDGSDPRTNQVSFDVKK